MDSNVSTHMITETVARTIVRTLIKAGAHLTSTSNGWTLQYRGVPFGLDTSKTYSTEEQVVDTILAQIIGRDFGSVKLAS